MPTAQRRVTAARPVKIGKSVSAVCVGDVDLDHHQIGRVVGAEPLDMIIDQLFVLVGQM